MTDQERAQVLKMIEEGRVTPEEGLRLLQTLEQHPVDDENASGGPAVSVPDMGAAGREASNEASASEADPSIRSIADKGRSLWYIPLAAGIGFTVLGGFIMYWNIHPTGTSAWAYCLGLPVLLLGVAVTALGAASRTARWIFVQVRQKPGERPHRIRFGFPLPLGLTAWFLRTFGRYIPDLEKVAADEILVALENTTSPDSPLVVNVDEGESGEKVQVYIG